MTDVPQDMDHSILCGDCLEVMPAIPDRCVDMILCDLPYGVTKNKWDSVIPLELLWEQYARVLRPSGVVVLTAFGKFSAMLMMSAKVEYQYSMVWCKANVTNQLNAKKQPLRQHEDILVFYSGRATYNPQGIVRREDVAGTTIVTQGSKLTTNYDQNYDRGKPYEQEWTNWPTSLVYTKSVFGPKRHPTEKPEELFAYFVSTYTNEGMLVLDNASGSGTTAVVCHRLRRRFICIEKDAKYHKESVARLAEESSTVFDEEEPPALPKASEPVSKPLVYVPPGAAMNTGNQDLDAPDTKYDRGVNSRDPNDKGWSDKI